MVEIAHNFRPKSVPAGGSAVESFGQILINLELGYHALLKHTQSHLRKYYKHLDIFADLIQLTVQNYDHWVVIYLKPEKIGWRITNNTAKVPDVLVLYEDLTSLHLAILEQVEAKPDEAWPVGNGKTKLYSSEPEFLRPDPPIGIRDTTPWVHKPLKFLRRLRWRLLRR